MDFARQREPEQAYVNINDILKATLAMRAYEMETGNVKLATLLDPDLPPTVADRGQLQQVFLNVIMNAETEMKLARGRGNLLIQTGVVDDTIRIYFTDDGPGIVCLIPSSLSGERAVEPGWVGLLTRSKL